MNIEQYRPFPWTDITNLKEFIYAQYDEGYRVLIADDNGILFTTEPPIPMFRSIEDANKFHDEIKAEYAR
jgi:hypothetical protein